MSWGAAPILAREFGHSFPGSGFSIMMIDQQLDAGSCLVQGRLDLGLSIMDSSVGEVKGCKNIY